MEFRYAKLHKQNAQHFAAQTSCPCCGNSLAVAYANAFIEVKAQSEDGLLTASAERIEARWRVGRKLHASSVRFQQMDEPDE